MIKKLNHVTLTGVSLKAAEPGDILVARGDLLMEYVGESQVDDYTHKVVYLNKKASKPAKKFGSGTRTDDGCVFMHLEHDGDIVMIISKHSWPLYALRANMIKKHKMKLKEWENLK